MSAIPGPVPDEAQRLEAILPAATYICARYQSEAQLWEDLLQEARIGVLMALRVYDPERGKKMKNGLVTLACYKANGAILDYLRKNRSLLGGLCHVMKSRDFLFSLVKRRTAKGLPVTPEALAEVTGFTVRFVKLAMSEELSIHWKHLDEQLPGESGARTLGDTLRAAEGPLTTEERIDLARVLSRLTETEAHLLRRHAEGCGLREIGRELGVTEKRAQTLRSRALKRAQGIAAQMEAGNVG